MNILDQLAEHARQRVEAAKQTVPLAEAKRQALAFPKGDFRFEKALAKPGLAFICECKKASPSKGLIAPDFPYLQIAKEYEAAGADAISVLTEPKWFLGRDAYLKEITSAVSTPCLRKDFTVDEYMIYEAKLLGASAVLLICAILDDAQLKEYLAICDSLGLSALVEAHDDAEVDRALAAGAQHPRREQPQPERLHSGYCKQPPPALPHPKECALRLRKRRKDRRGCSTACSHWGGCGAHWRNAHARAG